MFYYNIDSSFFAAMDCKTFQKGVDISDQMTSYHTPLRRSLKWYRKLAIEIIVVMTVVNAYVLFNKYYTNKPIKIRNFRDSLVLSLTYVMEEPQRLGRAPFSIQGNACNHVLSEGNKVNNGRKRCCGCYDKISKNENTKLAPNKARRVSSYCVQCEGNLIYALTALQKNMDFTK